MVSTHKTRLIFSSLFIALLIAVDYFSKAWLIEYLKRVPAMKVELSSFFELVYVWNYGISFGILRGYYQYSNYGLLVVNSLIVAYICYLLWQCCKKSPHPEPGSGPYEMLKTWRHDTCCEDNYHKKPLE